MTPSTDLQLPYLHDWLPDGDGLLLLDIGFGTPEQALAIRAFENLAEYIGIDLDESAVQQTKTQWPEATLICGDAGKLDHHYHRYVDAILIRRPDLFLRPQNWMRVFAALPILLKAHGRIIVTTIGSSEAETTRMWLESFGMTIIHFEEVELEEESFLLIAEANQKETSPVAILSIDTFPGESMACDPITGICYFPVDEELTDVR